MILKIFQEGKCHPICCSIFQPRALVDLLRSWLTIDYTLEVLETITDRPDEVLKGTLQKAIRDEDWEVKLRGVRFFKELMSSPYISVTLARKLFFTLQADNLLLEAVADFVIEDIDSFVDPGS
jgi:hypothetical protein